MIMACSLPQVVLPETPSRHRTKKGAITILLLDGLAITELMVERGIGVVRQPVYLHEIDPNFFDYGED